jgi:hybrid cluster-associated redox disulfide protein
MIDKRTSIWDVLARYPQTARVFEEFGLGCAGCEAALFESIETVRRSTVLMLIVSSKAS